MPLFDTISMPGVSMHKAMNPLFGSLPVLHNGRPFNGHSLVVLIKQQDRSHLTKGNIFITLKKVSI
jgi:hypothetical protein